VTTTQLARAAYGTTAGPIRTDRGTEYAAFQKITAQLTRVAADNAQFADRARAIHDNRQLWTILATDLAGDKNGLPQGLRAQLFYLAEFTILHSSKVLREGASLTPLIDINTAVMRGLGDTRAAA
jgi:flagellar protein FlaF